MPRFVNLFLWKHPQECQLHFKTELQTEKLKFLFCAHVSWRRGGPLRLLNECPQSQERLWSVWEGTVLQPLSSGDLLWTLSVPSSHKGSCLWARAFGLCSCQWPEVGSGGWTTAAASEALPLAAAAPASWPWLVRGAWTCLMPCSSRRDAAWHAIRFVKRKQMLFFFSRANSR